ncbi:MAG: peptidoglycan bridge formation glycyltransferase FemA/FemB family protein [Candidatus Wildermuthbacteria bacterium]|nr:peptidoglycan bridge formation glycyltransferase FemA/FemB family protein [Candidatus Wildermuthbacteria bacterium]
MQVKEAIDQDIWEGFLGKCAERTFLQSWNWGEFWQKNGLSACSDSETRRAGRQGNMVLRLGVFEGDELLGVALVVKVSAKRGTYLLVQHAPIIQKSKLKTEILKAFLWELKKIGKQEGASFIRMAPLWERTGENERMLREFGFRQAPMHANAYEATWKLDITSSEEELLKGMRKTTRYLIRQAMKNPDIQVTQSDRPEDVVMYAQLNEAVATRQQFVPFSKEFIKNEFEIFSKEGEALLFFGKYKGQVVAAALVIFWSGIAFYHQAASLGEFAKLSIPYLVQWEAIREAKRRGCALYDFWGYVDPKKYPNHPWAGPTLFKMGFGGRAFEYMKTQDFVLSLRYWPIALFEKLRRFSRHL